MDEKIEIPLSKNKIVLLILGSLLFFAIGVWLLNFSGLKWIMGIVAILFFGATGIFGIKKFSDKKAGLIIDKNGITDNSSALSIGLIAWADIKDIAVNQIMSTKFLMINVVDPEKYIERAKNGMQSKLMRSNMKMYGTPLSISSTTLKYNFEKLNTLIQTELKRHKK